MKIVKERLFEDIPDNYYQRKFGVMSDDTTTVDSNYIVAKVRGNTGKTSTPIVMNPTNMDFKEFDEGSRAIIDEYGNLYVALKDLSISHGDMGNALMKAGLITCKTLWNQETYKGGVYAEPDRFITCHYDGEYVVGADSMKWGDTTENIINKMLEKNPNVELGNDMYEYDEDEK